MTGNRGINTVVDVALALLFLAVAVALFSTLPLSSNGDHDPYDADRTATVVGTSTLNVTYSLGPVLEDAADELKHITYDGTDDEADVKRISHGTTASLMADTAIANLTVDSERVTDAGLYYENEIDHLIQTQLVGSQFESSITAHWEPFTGSPVSATATVGAEPPPDADISTSKMTVSSGFDASREPAIAATVNGGGYGRVADIVASTVVEGYLPPVESKRALERGESDQILTRYRYERFATLLPGADPEAISPNLRASSADPTVANEYLSGKLANQLETELERSFDSPKAAAESVSTNEIAVTVRTWES